VSVRDFYDGLALDFHLFYEDWYAAVERHGAALDRLIRAIHKNPVDVLDCSCGIGTQAIGLARLGYRVQGTDISERSLERHALRRHALASTHRPFSPTDRRPGGMDGCAPQQPLPGGWTSDAHSGC